MASRIRNKSVLRTASWVRSTEFLYCTSPIAARIEISEITTRSSTRVKPRERRGPGSSSDGRRRRPRDQRPLANDHRSGNDQRSTSDERPPANEFMITFYQSLYFVPSRAF